mgnify:FL=1
MPGRRLRSNLPKGGDRQGSGPSSSGARPWGNADGAKIRFSSSLVPPYLRKAKSVEELLPWLYLKGISTGDFSEALASLVGPDADEYGNKDVLGIMDGFHENADSWRDLLGILKKRGLTIAPDLACGDGVMGFWTALRDVYPTTKEQRCWVHKMANITGAMPKPMHEKAKAGLQDICPLGYARMPCQVIDGRDEE